MKRIILVVLLACLMGQSCSPVPAPAPDNSSNSNTGSDNQTGDPGGSGQIATFTIKKSALKSTFDASGVSAPGYTADVLQVRWDFTADGTFDTDWSTKKVATYSYPNDGSYNVTMEMKDPSGHIDSATKTFNIAAANTAPNAVFNVNIVKGMTASVDASSSNDTEDAVDDLRIRWDWDGDNVYDTDWTTDKAAQYTYATAGEYTIHLQVKDLNDTIKTATQKIVASPITIRNGFITYGTPYMIQLHFRMVNNITEQPVTPADVPPLTRGFFTISEDNLPIDLSETNQILYNGERPMYIVLVLDFTGSMYDAGAIEPMLESAKAFIDSQGGNTYLSLWAFYERQGGNTEIDDFTRCLPAGRIRLKADLDAFASTPHDRGATEIWDLLLQVLNAKFPSVDTGVNRGIVFLTDGHDTTSTTNINTLIDATQKKATFMFPVGMAFRPQEYTADEPNLKKIADSTGGLYFTVNQVTDLAIVFGQLSDDVKADWTLSYITLKSTGTPTVKVVCNYLDGYATMTGKFPVTNQIKGDIKQGLLTVLPELDSPAGQTLYALYAGYIPRNISTIKVKVTSASPINATLYDADAICKASEGWSISPDVAAGAAVPADGWYTLSSATPLEYGSWGRVAKLTVGATNLPAGAVHVELPALVDQAALYGDKTIVFISTGGVTLDVP